MVGQCKANISETDKGQRVAFIVADTTKPQLLRIKTCQELNLVKSEWIVNLNAPNYMQEYNHVFGELD